MQMIHRWRITAMIIAVLALALIVAGISGIVTTVSVLAIIAAAVLWQLAERKDQARMIAVIHQEKDLEMMRALSHYRHDWMNDLQVLFGYVSLKKYDKLAPYLERIKNKLGEESHIANIGNTSLSLLLMSYRLYSHNFDLHVSLDKSVNLQEIPVRQERLVQIVREGLQLFRQTAAQSAVTEEPNILELTIVTTDEHVELIYQYTGQYDAAIERLLDEWTSRSKEDFRAQSEYIIEDDQIDLIMKVHFE